MKGNLLKKALSILLSVIFILGCLPITALAAPGTPFMNVASVTEDSYGTNTKSYLVESTVGQKMRVVFYTDDIFRIWLADGGTGNFSESESEVILVKTDFGQTPDVTLSNEGGVWSFSTPALTLRLDAGTAMFECEKDGVVVWKEAASLKYDSTTTQTLLTDETEYFYGSGMQMGSFSHKGKEIKIERGGWSEGGVPNPVAFYMSTKGYGVLRNTYNTGTYDFRNNNVIETEHSENRFDAFYFSGSFGEMLDGYTEMTGRAPLIPNWGIGMGDASAYRQKYDTTEQGGNPANRGDQRPETDPENGFWHETLGSTRVGLDVKTDYIDKKFPVAWMLPSDGYGAEYNNWTHPGGTLATASYGGKAADATGKDGAYTLGTDVPGLMKYGARLGLWVGQPGNYRRENGYTYADGTDAGFAKEIAAQVRDGGLRVYKIDVAWSSQQGLRGDMTNIFSRMLNNIETNSVTEENPSGERGMLVTVYGAAGSQRYATVWSGDQSGNDDYVRYHIPAFTGAGMSGFPYATSDQAGIYGDTPGVYVRDMQMKSLMPMNYAMNNWGGITGGRNTAIKRPSGFAGGDTRGARGTVDRFTPEELASNHKYAMLNRQIKPYLYSYARQSYDHGAPIIRPMVYNYPQDTYTYDDKTQYQYMSGDWLLAAPVYNGKDMSRSNVYLPAGRWTDYWTGTDYFGPANITVDAPMDTMPIFVRSGAIIPMQAPSVYDGQRTVDGDYMSEDTFGAEGVAVDDGRLVLDLYPEGQTSFDLYEDDGYTLKYKDGAYTNTKITSDAPAPGMTGALTVTVGAAEGEGYEGQEAARANALTIHTSRAPGAVKVNGANLPKLASAAAVSESVSGGWFYTSDNGGVLTVKTPVYSVDNETVVWVDRYATPALPEYETALQMPKNVQIVESTTSSLTVGWQPVEGATYYELEIDGTSPIRINPAGDGTVQYVYGGLDFESSHLFRVRAFNDSQKSGWTAPLKGTTLPNPDPYKIPLTVENLLWAKGNYGGDILAHAVDDSDNTLFHSPTAVNGPETFDVDFGETLMINKVRYAPRHDNYTNGTVTAFRLYTSMDGETWTQVTGDLKVTRAKSGYSGENWPYEEDIYTETQTVAAGGNIIRGRYDYDDVIEFPPTFANFVRLEKISAIGNFFSMTDFSVWRTDKDISMVSLTTGKEAEASSQWAAKDIVLEEVTGCISSAENFATDGGFFGSHVSDNDPETDWYSTTNMGNKLPAEVVITLPANKEIQGIQYVPGTAKGSEGRITEYAVYITTPSNERVWVAGGEWPADGEIHDVRFRPVLAKAVNFVAIAGEGGIAGAKAIVPLTEPVAVSYEETEITDRGNWVGRSNVGNIYAAADTGTVSAAITDNSLTSYAETTYSQTNWNTAHWPAYYTLDLGEPTFVTRVDYAPRDNGNGKLRGYTVWYSLDGVAWQQGGTGALAQTGNGYNTLNWDYRHPVRYIRVSSKFDENLIGAANGSFVGHPVSNVTTMFGWNAGTMVSVSDIRVFEDTAVDVTDPAVQDSTVIRKLTSAADGISVYDTSSNPGTNARILDNTDPSVFWESSYISVADTANQWVVFDLGEERVINNIDYRPRSNSANGRLRGYELLASASPTGPWTHISYGYGWDNTNVQALAWQYDEPVRYIKLAPAVFGDMETKLSTTESSPASVPVGNSAGSAYAYGSGNQIAISQIVFYERLADSGDAQYLAPEPAFSPRHAIDGSSETGWSSAAGMAEQTLTVDLGDPALIDYASVSFGNEKPTAFTLELSEDGNNWAEAANVSGNTGDHLFMAVNPAVEARYARLTLSGNANGYTVRSFDLFGPGAAESLVLDKTAADMNIDGELTLSATILPETLRNKTIIWSSSDTSVATVANGVVKAIGAGTATITAMSDADNSLTATCTVTVAALPLDAVVLDITEKVIAVGENIQLTASLQPTNTTYKEVVWSVSDDSIATVSEDGFVTALKEGVATIKATSATDSSKFAECIVTVSDIISVEADNRTGELTVSFNELPSDVMKMLFSADWTNGDSDETTALTLDNMVIDRENNAVTFTFEPIKGDPGEAFEATINVRYNDGQTVSSPAFSVEEERYDLETTFDKEDIAAAAGSDLTVSATVTKNGESADDTVNVIIALYSGNDQLLSAKQETLEFDGLETLSADLTLSIPADAAESGCVVKVFYWDGTFAPIAAAAEFE